MSLQQLRENLDKGFFIDNLYEMSRLCRDMALESNNPAPLFIMQKIFSSIADYWDEMPVDVEDASLVEAQMVKPLRELIDAIEAEASGERVKQLLDKAVSSYLFLFK